MIRPKCSLCQRRNRDCVYPTKRKRHVSRPPGSEKRSSRYAVKALDEKLGKCQNYGSFCKHFLINVDTDRLMQFVARGSSSNEINGSSSSESPCHSEASEQSLQETSLVREPDTLQGNQEPTALGSPYNEFYDHEQLFTSDQEFSQEQHSAWKIFNDFETAIFTDGLNMNERPGLTAINGSHNVPSFDTEPQTNHAHGFLRETIPPPYIPQPIQNITDTALDLTMHDNLNANSYSMPEAPSLIENL